MNHLKILFFVGSILISASALAEGGADRIAERMESLRDKWEFQYTADKLTEACKVKIKHHTERLDWWTNKQKEVKGIIQKEGIEIDESLVDDDFKLSNTYRGASVSIRNDLVDDLTETVSKIKEHRGKLLNYTGWEQVLASQGSKALMLTQSDWLYFFGK